MLFPETESAQGLSCVWETFASKVQNRLLTWQDRARRVRDVTDEV